MSDLFYDAVVLACRPAFAVSSRPTVLGRAHVPRRGAFLLAANHTCPYDVPLLIRHTPRRVDFVSIAEVMRLPAVGPFYRGMNAFALDRTRRDAGAVRTILDRLAHGRVVGMFPEGGFRRGEASVVRSRKIKAGIGRVALLADVPIVPAAVVGSEAYARVASWLPVRGVRYGVAYGEPIAPEGEPSAIEARLVDAICALHGELTTRLPPV